jgi:transmembrane sensor
MAHSSHDDTIWQQALDWVLRDHEQPLDSDRAARLRAWLDANQAHRTAYREARHLWLLTGLVPPATLDTNDDVPPLDPDASPR